MQFIEKLKSAIDFTNRSGSIGFERQQAASDGSRGILSVSSGAIDDRSRVFELSSPREENRERGAGFNEAQVFVQCVEERQCALILLNGLLIPPQAP